MGIDPAQAAAEGVRDALRRLHAAVDAAMEAGLLVQLAIGVRDAKLANGQVMVREAVKAVVARPL